MSLNLIASAASSVAHFGSPIDPIAHESPATIGHPLDAVALNPQPLPPRELGLGSLHNRFDAVALNPQPLPPREVQLGSVLRSVNAVALNPQPLPPHEGGLRSILRSLDAVALNPQPLPPRETLSLAAHRHRGRRVLRHRAAPAAVAACAALAGGRAPSRRGARLVAFHLQVFVAPHLVQL